MKVDKINCDMCGKEFDEFDKQEMFCIYQSEIGYGSKFDGDNIDIDLCCCCFDKLMDEYVIPKLSKDHPFRKDYEINNEGE